MTKDERHPIVAGFSDLCDDLEAKNRERMEFPIYKRRAQRMKEPKRVDANGLIVMAMLCATLLGMTALIIWAVKG